MIKEFTREKAWADEVKLAQEIQNKIYIKHFNSPVFKGFANDFLLKLLFCVWKR